MFCSENNFIDLRRLLTEPLLTYSRLVRQVPSQRQISV